ncbi:MAG: N-acetylglucosamine kinase [Fermentimonas sp.]|jgi:glucosamine kinase
MILIADSGSSTTNWTLVDDREIVFQFESEGYNPCYNSSDEIKRSLSKSLPEGYDWSKIKLVAFYGAGCYEDKYIVIEDALRPLFPHARFDVAMDLVASARALLGNKPGFAAILGTGTNSCLYDGTRITHNVDSMGFLLGDEGSGAYMGKRIIADFIRGHMSQEVSTLFYNTYGLTPGALVDNVYATSMPNRYCASFTRFLSFDAMAKSDYAERVKRDAFRDFFNNIVVYYPGYSDHLFNCVGSIGWVFKDTLAAVAEEYGMKVGKIVQSPMEGLIAYHHV